MAAQATSDEVYLLDYGAGNVRSLVNAVNHLGFSIRRIESVHDFAKAKKLIFPGVGAFGACMDRLASLGYIEPLRQYIASNRPFFGICVGMQCLCKSSDESPGVNGLGIIDAVVSKFQTSTKSVPHMGWNAAIVQKRLACKDDDDGCKAVGLAPPTDADARYYFVHSFAVKTHSDGSSAMDGNLSDWIQSLTTYGDETFVSSVRRGNVFATQFHPEKSGMAGLAVLEAFLKAPLPDQQSLADPVSVSGTINQLVTPPDALSRRIIACLDVRANDDGDLVVTKGDQYDVRETTTDTNQRGRVRNLGKPVDLARRYYEEGADEVTFLNITSFRDCPLRDLPMLQILERTSECVFVPLTIGGGIRDVVEPDGTVIPALRVAGEYFRSGADKVSIGSDAVYAAETYWERGAEKRGDTAIEQIATVYGAQAVVISVDPRRVYVSEKDAAGHPHHLVKCGTGPDDAPLGPNGEPHCWYQCTVKGGREGRNLDVIQLVTACEALGAGEILLNCMDRDGTNSGFEHVLIRSVKSVVKSPVIASSGAGSVDHFSNVFRATNVDAALAAGIFHRREVPISSVKSHLSSTGFSVRRT